MIPQDAETISAVWTVLIGYIVPLALALCAPFGLVLLGRTINNLADADLERQTATGFALRWRIGAHHVADAEHALPDLRRIRAQQTAATADASSQEGTT